MSANQAQNRDRISSEPIIPHTGTGNHPVADIPTEYQAGIELLTTQGVHFHHPEALDRFEHAGAEIFDDSLVRIPPQLVAWALQTAPKQVTLYRRDGRPAIQIGGDHTYFGAGLNCTNYCDDRFGKHRPATLADLSRAVRLIDALPNLDFVTPVFWPSDVPQETAECYQMEVMLTESSKPILLNSRSRSSLVNLIEMAALAVGGRDSLIARPLVTVLVCPGSLLEYDKSEVENILASAECQVPIICTPQITRSATTPSTSPAALQAGQLAGLTLAQIVTEGTPYVIDPLKSAGYSNAKLFDAQAAAEAVLTLFVTIQSRSKLIHKMGCLDRDQTGSLSLIACCDELVAWIMHSLGKRPNKGWAPELLDWDDYETWVAAGGLNLEQRVLRRVENLLASHQPEELAMNARYRVKGIIQRANASIRWTEGA